MRRAAGRRAPRGAADAASVLFGTGRDERPSAASPTLRRPVTRSRAHAFPSPSSLACSSPRALDPCPPLRSSARLRARGACALRPRVRFVLPWSPRRHVVPAPCARGRWGCQGGPRALKPNLNQCSPTATALADLSRWHITRRWCLSSSPRSPLTRPSPHLSVPSDGRDALFSSGPCRPALSSVKASVPRLSASVLRSPRRFVAHIAVRVVGRIRGLVASSSRPLPCLASGSEDLCGGRTARGAHARLSGRESDEGSCCSESCLLTGSFALIPLDMPLTARGRALCLPRIVSCLPHPLPPPADVACRALYRDARRALARSSASLCCDTLFYVRLVRRFVVCGRRATPRGACASLDAYGMLRFLALLLHPCPPWRVALLLALSLFLLLRSRKGASLPRLVDSAETCGSLVGLRRCCSEAGSNQAELVGSWDACQVAYPVPKAKAHISTRRRADCSCTPTVPLLRLSFFPGRHLHSPSFLLSLPRSLGTLLRPLVGLWRPPPLRALHAPSHPLLSPRYAFLFPLGMPPLPQVVRSLPCPSSPSHSVMNLSSTNMIGTCRLTLVTDDLILRAALPAAGEGRVGRRWRPPPLLRPASLLRAVVAPDPISATGDVDDFASVNPPNGHLALGNDNPLRSPESPVSSCGAGVVWGLGGAVPRRCARPPDPLVTLAFLALCSPFVRWVALSLVSVAVDGLWNYRLSRWVSRRPLMSSVLLLRPHQAPRETRPIGRVGSCPCSGALLSSPSLFFPSRALAGAPCSGALGPRAAGPGAERPPVLGWESALFESRADLS